MSPYLRTALGVTLGLAASMVVLAVYQRGGGPADSGPGPLLSDCDGRLQHLVIHYVEEAADTVVPTYRDFLGQLPADVTVSVVCPRPETFDDLVSRIGPVECRLSPVVVSHAMTTWSRDRWLALGPSPGGRMLLLAPRGKTRPACGPRGRPTDCGRSGRRARPRRGGPHQRPVLRRRRLHGRRRDGLRAAGRAAAEPATHGGHAEELVARLESILQRRVILFDDAPDHHVGMYLMPVGDRTVLVADPRLGEPLFQQRQSWSRLPTCRRS